MAKPPRKKRGTFSPEERQRRRERMLKQRSEGRMVKQKSVDRMSDTELRSFMEEQVAQLPSDVVDRVIAEYTRPLSEDVEATSTDVNGEAPASAREHEGPEPAKPHTEPHTRSALTSADEDTDLDRALNKLARNINANLEADREWRRTHGTSRARVSLSSLPGARVSAPHHVPGLAVRAPTSAPLTHAPTRGGTKHPPGPTCAPRTPPVSKRPASTPPPRTFDLAPHRRIA